MPFVVAESPVLLPAKREMTVRRWTSLSWAMMLSLMVIAACYGGLYLKRGWIPHDEGAFALTAQHALHGELPHRDFDEIYTGGLTYLNAAAMRVLGENLVSMRYPVYAVFIFWTAAIFSLARRFVSDWAAAFVTLLLIAISYPNYTAAVPSWYNLFFATIGIWALFRFTETERLLWVFLAGLSGGLSFLVKVPGLYFVAAALCFLLFHEQEQDRAESRGSHVIRYGIAMLAVGFVFLVWRTIGWRMEPRFVVHFVLPSVAVMSVLAAREFTAGKGSDFLRLKRLFRLSSVLLAGVLLPILLFLFPYIRSGAVHSFVSGVFVLPFRRVGFAAQAPEKLDNLLACGALVVLLVYASTRRMSKAATIALAAMMAAGIVFSGVWRPAYHILWSAITFLVPLTVCVAIWRLHGCEMSSLQRARIFLLTAVVGICALVRFPFASPIYLLYILPLVPLIWIALASSSREWSPSIFGAIAAGYVIFFALRVTPSFITNMGIRYQPLSMAKLDLPVAGGLRVPLEDRATYEQIARLVSEHANGDYIYAAPDCPQVYVLTGRKQADPVMFDFFEQSTPERRERILSELVNHSAKTVVILNKPAFSPPMDRDLHTNLAARFPEEQTVGDFEVRWAK